jgi:hypothetical protein
MIFSSDSPSAISSTVGIMSLVLACFSPFEIDVMIVMSAMLKLKKLTGTATIQGPDEFNHFFIFPHAYDNACTDA